MKLIVGLGNPGKEYENTRHNVGFLAVDNYANINNLTAKEKFNGLYYEKLVNNEKVILLKPLSYMNLSGSVVRKYAEYFKIEVDDILIIYDDMDFETGEFKIKPSGSSAGHNGINDIIMNLNTENIKRMRIGISRKKTNKINYVIGRISKKEKELLNKVIKISGKVIDDFITMDYNDLMNKYNKR